MPRICDKLKCLGKRQKLERNQASLINWLAEVSHIDFENISLFQNNKYEDAVKHFLDWVDHNKIYATSDELVANIDANKQVLNLANVKLNEFKDMYMKIRELATLMADKAHTPEQRHEFAQEVVSIQKQINDIYLELEFNGMRVFDRQWSVRSDYESRYCNSRKQYNILSSDPVNFEGASFNFVAIKAEIIVFARKYRSSRNEDERAAYSDHLTSVIDTINKFLECELARVESCYKQLCRSRENVLRQKETATETLRSQRDQAKKAVEEKLCNVAQQITYMSLCINHNTNCI